MKDRSVNPKRLKKGVIYRFTRRYTGVEYWEFVKLVEPNDYENNTSWEFKQIYGNFYPNGSSSYIDSIDLAFYLFYTNEKDKKFLKNFKRK